MQSLRIVTKLEERYAEFDGLNLTFETLSGILKHCSLKNAHKLGVLGERFINKKSPSLEAQLANIADELAYNFHDLDDGLRAGLLNLDELESLDIIKQELDVVKNKYPHLKDRRLHKELVRHLINTSIYELIDSSQQNLAQSRVASLEDVYNAPNLIGYSEDFYAKQRELKKFLFKHLYNHYTVMQLRYKSENVIRSLFKAFMSDERLLPEQYKLKIESSNHARIVADYISGMTDRYAFRQYNRLFNVESI